MHYPSPSLRCTMYIYGSRSTPVVYQVPTSILRYRLPSMHKAHFTPPFCLATRWRRSRSSSSASKTVMKPKPLARKVVCLMIQACATQRMWSCGESKRRRSKSTNDRLHVLENILARSRIDFKRRGLWNEVRYREGKVSEYGPTDRRPRCSSPDRQVTR